jgi:hypothetical protein
MKRKAKRIAPTTANSPRKSLPIPMEIDDGFGASVPPSLGTLTIYFDQKGEREIARDFYEEHELRQWKSATGQLVTNWKVCAAEWIYNYRQDRKRRFRQSQFYNESI